MSEFPFTEYDAHCRPDANAMHMLHLLEGYRAYVLGGEFLSPYSPGCARDDSWRKGYHQAQSDFRTRVEEPLYEGDPLNDGRQRL